MTTDDSHARTGFRETTTSRRIASSSNSDGADSVVSQPVVLEDSEGKRSSLVLSLSYWRRTHLQTSDTPEGGRLVVASQNGAVAFQGGAPRCQIVCTTIRAPCNVHDEFLQTFDMRRLSPRAVAELAGPTWRMMIQRRHLTARTSSLRPQLTRSLAWSRMPKATRATPS